VHKAICNVKAAGDKKIEGDDTKPVNRILLFAYSTARIRDRQKKKRVATGTWKAQPVAVRMYQSSRLVVTAESPDAVD